MGNRSQNGPGDGRVERESSLKTARHRQVGYRQQLANDTVSVDEALDSCGSGPKQWSADSQEQDT